ncbi:MAG: CBS domain-containing protein [Patescibacteria group bacterium]
MLVKQIMTKTVITAKPDDRIKDIASLLYRRNLSGVPIIDDSNKVIGIVTEFDFINPDLEVHIPTYVDFLDSLEVDDTTNEMDEAVDRLKEATIDQIMTRDVKTVLETTDVKEVVKMITTYRINPIPVVDNQNTLIGIVSRADLIKILE